MIAGVTYWLGMVFILAIGLFFRAAMISQLDHFEPHINMLIGFAALGGLLAYLAWVSIEHRWTRIQGFKLELPGFKLTTAQIVLSVIDLCAAAGVLYVLLPEPHSMRLLHLCGGLCFRLRARHRKLCARRHRRL